MIKINNLNKYYNKGKSNEYHVINNINYEFEENGLYSIFGHSGCGKTTLLNVIGCLDSFDSGEIIYDEKSFNKYIPKSADEIRNKLIGYIFQNYNLVESLTVSENIKVILEMIGITNKEEQNKRISNVLKAVGLYNYRKRSVQALSGGERQRVAIARALAKNPKIILADEPTGNLDSNNTFEVMNIIKSISKDRLVILVSHEKDLVDYYSDVIIELEDGVIKSEKINNNSNSLNRIDSRNIYLKDYQKFTNTTNNIVTNLYSNEDIKDIEFNIVYKDGQIYVKTISSNRVHFIDENSEIKLLDMSEKDYNKQIENKESNFKLEEFNDNNFDAKHKYISLLSSIKSSFKSKGYLKRNKLMRFIFALSGVIFASLFCSISAIFAFTEKDYKNIPDNVVAVEIEKKDAQKGLSTSTLIEYAKTIDGYVSYHAPIETNSISNMLYYYYSYSDNSYITYQLGRFYQTIESDTGLNEKVYVQSNKNITVTYGKNITNSNEIILSEWVGETMLDSSNAKINGYTTLDELIGIEISLTQNNTTNNFILVGFTNSKCDIAYVDESAYITGSIPDGYIFIECTDKNSMIDNLSNEYSNVYDPLDGAMMKYLKEVIENNISKIIFLSIMTIAIFIYIVLMIRSNMFNRIKDIGILRSIGATKKDVQSIFVGDIIAITTKYFLLAYSIMYFIIFYFSNQFSLEDVGIKLFNASISTFFVGMLFCYALFVISTIIPVSILMRKTPVEIIKKYDI